MVEFGSLPMERYILSRWGESTLDGLNRDARRERLARDFVDLGSMGRFLTLTPFGGDPPLSDSPPQEQWPEILKDLRTEHQRGLASTYHDGHVWLRTCYTNGSDEQHQTLLDDFEAAEALDSEDLVLDDAELYSYGSDWARIFSVLPEVLLQVENCSESAAYWKEIIDSVSRHLEREEWIIEQQKECIARQPSTRDKLSAAFHDQSEGESEDESEGGFGWSLRSFHLASTHSWCVVADEEAMQTGLVLLVFFDDQGRVVRQGRRTPSDCTYTEGAFVDGCIDEDETMNYGEPGPTYSVGGIRGPPFEDYRTVWTRPRPRRFINGPPPIRDPETFQRLLDDEPVIRAIVRQSTPELGPAYLADRQRVLDRLKPGV